MIKTYSNINPNIYIYKYIYNILIMALLTQGIWYSD